LQDFGTNDNKPQQEDEKKDDSPAGIYANQWMARNIYGSTIMCEFFYNEGSLDGNEVMRQYILVCTSLALAGLKTIGTVCDMAGGNERFFALMNDGRQIDVNHETWPVHYVKFRNPVEPDSDIHAWSCSTHGLKNLRSQVAKSRRDGSGSRQFIDGDGVEFGWWANWEALQRDKDRESK
jgi:hypothetical protein